eukprot:SAG31_NODE_10226_length_1168_cov_0.909261_1_plen_47_part_10
MLQALAAQPDAPIRHLHEGEVAKISREADLDGNGGIDFDEVPHQHPV